MSDEFQEIICSLINGQNAQALNQVERLTWPKFLTEFQAFEYSGSEKLRFLERLLIQQHGWA